MRQILYKLTRSSWFYLVIIVLTLIVKFVVDEEENIGSFLIYEGDFRFMYPYIEHAQVSSEELVVVCLIPLMAYVAWILYLLFQRYTGIKYDQIEWKLQINRLYNYFSFLCFSYMCLFLTMMFTEVLKSVVAMPRPNFFHMCNYKQINTDYQYYLANTNTNQIVNLDDCFASDEDTEESQLSFPSGHSSYSFSIALSSLIFSYWMKFSSITTISTFLLFFLAIYVGVSRIMDYYHNVHDVLFGFFLACCVSGSCFIIFYDILERVLNNSIE